MKFRKTVSLLLAILTLMGLLSTSAFALDLSNWTTKTNMLKAAYAFGSICIDDKIYVFGGYNSSSSVIDTLQVYDSSTDTWTEKTSMPTARLNMSIAKVNGKIYTIGGCIGTWKNLTNVNEVYDPSTDTWETKTSMPVSLSACATAVIDNKIYVIGGYNSSDTTLKALYVYDTDTDTWTTMANMQIARRNATAVIANNLIYVIGGYNGLTTTYDTVETYNPTTDTWTLLSSKLQEAVLCTRALNIDGDIYIFGGLITNATVGTNKIEKYDYEANSWSTVGTLPENRGEEGVALINNSVYIFGGRSTTSIVYNSNKQCCLAIAPVLSASASDGQTILSWNTADGATSYNVYRSTTSGGTYTKIASGVTTTSYTDTAVTNGTTYYYVITTIVNSNESNYSNEVSATPMGGEYNPSVLINVGETQQLSVTDYLADNSKLNWSSTDESVVTVDSKGRVTGVAEGTANIYAISDDTTFSQFIPVKVVYSSVDDMTLSLYLNVGDQAKLYISDDIDSITWSSLDESIATVSATGKVTAVSKGLVIIQGVVDGNTYQFYVRVDN